MNSDHFRWLAGRFFGGLLLAGLFLTGFCLSADQHVINFDTLTASYVFNATHQPYADLGDGHGVTFSSNALPTVTAWTDAHTGTKVLRNVPPLGSEFGSADEKITFSLVGFTSPYVRVFVGMDERSPVPVTAQMFAYRTDGGYADLVGSATVSLGNGPTPCYHELKVETTEGSANHGAISYVEITYGSAFPPEVLDTLLVKVFDGGVAPPPDDTSPPVVTITDVSPDNPVRTHVVFVGGTVEEDRGLLYLQSWHDGYGMNPVTPIPIPGTNRYLFSTPVTFDDTEGTHTVSIRAVDFGGNDDQDGADVEYTPPDPPPPAYPDTLDFQARGLEATQAIQGWEKLGVTPPGPSHTTSLICGKKTLVRVYATLTGTHENIPGVPCLLHAYRGAVELPGSPIYALNELTLNDFETLDAQRRDTTRSFNFILPDNWTEPGTVRFEATVNAWNHVPEAPGAYNAFNSTIQDVSFFDTTCSLTMHVYTVRSANESNAEPTWTNCVDNVVRTRQIYPVPPDRIRTLHSGRATTHEVLSTGNDDNLSAFLHGLHYALGFRHSQPPTWNCGSVWLALTHPSFRHRGITDADFPVCISVASTDEFYRMTTAHEIGHAMGMDHVKGCSNPAEPYEDYPSYRQPGGAYLPDASIGDWGVQIEPDNSLSLKNPNDFGAMMSYCNDTWMSVFTWNWLFSHFGAHRTGPVAPSVVAAPANVRIDSSSASLAPYLYISGLIQPKAIILDPAWRSLLPAGSADQQGSGQYKLFLSDAQGNILFERHFDPDLILDLPGFGLFTEVVPAKAGTTKLVLDGGNSGVITLKAGPNAPEVTVLSPNGGEYWSPTGYATVSWTANDKDGDSMTFAILFSRDNGAAWQMVADNLGKSPYAVDLATLPQGLKSCLIKVEATDGINTGEDVSNLPFTKYGQPSLVSIGAPKTLTIFSQNDTVVFEGVVSDIDEPDLPVAHMVWSSSRSGVLGSGQSLAVRNLAAGLHEIEFRAEDSDGQSGTDYTYVYIRPDDAQMMPGDLNLDIRLSALDLVIMAHYLADNVVPGQYPFLAPETSAELSGPAGVTILDLMTLLQMLTQY